MPELDADRGERAARALRREHLREQGLARPRMTEDERGGLQGRAGGQMPGQEVGEFLAPGDRRPPPPVLGRASVLIVQGDDTESRIDVRLCHCGDGQPGQCVRLVGGDQGPAELRQVRPRQALADRLRPPPGLARVLPWPGLDEPFELCGDPVEREPDVPVLGGGGLQFGQTEPHRELGPQRRELDDASRVVLHGGFRQHVEQGLLETALLGLVERVPFGQSPDEAGGPDRHLAEDREQAVRHAPRRVAGRGQRQTQGSEIRDQRREERDRTSGFGGGRLVVRGGLRERQLVSADEFELAGEQRLDRLERLVERRDDDDRVRSGEYLVPTVRLGLADHRVHPPHDLQRVVGEQLQ